MFHNIFKHYSTLLLLYVRHISMDYATELFTLLLLSVMRLKFIMLKQHDNRDKQIITSWRVNNTVIRIHV